MSYLDRIAECNRYTPGDYLPLEVNERGVGWVRPEFAAHLRDWPEVFTVDARAVTLNPALGTFQERTEAVDEVVEALIAKGVIERHHAERYPVIAGRREEALFLLDRGAAAYFGIRAFGQHLNGYVRADDGIRMWVARRSRTKWNAPGKLDQLVAGGLPYGLSLEENLRKECEEEAAIPAHLADRAKYVGKVTYRRENRQGLRPDTIYCYDLELPADFVPRANDGEVDDFYLWPLERVAETVRDTREFKLNCNLVIIDFLLRWEYLNREEAEHSLLESALRR